MNLTKRPCKLGSSLNTRTEKHGEDEVPACDIPIVGLMLDKAELDALVGEHFWNVLFNTPIGDGKLPAPAWPQIANVKLKDKFAGSAIIHLGDNVKAVDLAGVTIKGISLDPLEGGLTEVSLTQAVASFVQRDGFHIIMGANFPGERVIVINFAKSNI